MQLTKTNIIIAIAITFIVGMSSYVVASAGLVSDWWLLVPLFLIILSIILGLILGVILWSYTFPSILSVARNNASLAVVFVGILILSLGVFFGGIGHLVDYGKWDFAQYAKDLYSNASTEFISIGITVIVIDRFMQLRDDKQREDEKSRDLERQEQELKRQLVFSAGSIIRSVAVDAVHQMQKRKWLNGENGILKGKDLAKAKLKGADLIGANLEHTSFLMTDLRNADMAYAKLYNADLSFSKLQKTRFDFANLENTDLDNSNLQEALLRDTILKGAKLHNVNLLGAHLKGAILNEETILPDGTYWIPETDMSRFTDPNHPEFWEPVYMTQRRQLDGK
jgi:hypothetical protein